MRLLKKNYPVMLATILALTAGFLVWVVIQNQAPTVPVVVAVDRLAVGEQITAEKVDVKNFPATMVGSNTYGDVQQVSGLTVTDGPIIKGAMVYKENLASTGTLQTLMRTYVPVSNDISSAPVLKPGKWVAVEVPAEIAMKGLNKGDFVDIYGEMPQSDAIYVKPIVKNAMVIELPSKDYPRYIVAVEEAQAGAAAEITVHKKLVSIVLPAEQPLVLSVTDLAGDKDSQLAVSENRKE